MTDEVQVRDMPFAISGTKATYQDTLFDGKTLAFEFVIDATTDRVTIDDQLDTLIGAAKRQQAIFELPLVKQSIAANIATLRDQEKARAAAAARVQAGSEIANAGRRNPRPAPEGEIQALAQFDQRIQNLKVQIAVAQTQVPYLEAVIRRDAVLPERFPQAARDDEEGAAQAA